MMIRTTRQGDLLNRRFGARLATALLLGGVMLSTATAMAADDDEKKVFMMRTWLVHRLNKAREQLSEKQYKMAMKTLASAREGTLSPHEKAVVTLNEGYVYVSQSDFESAAKSFEVALAADALPDQTVLELHNNLGQIYMMRKQYKKSLVHLLRRISKTKNPKGKDYGMIASAYVQAGLSTKAIKWARKAVKSTPKPKESWMLFLVGSLFKKALKAEGKAGNPTFGELVPVLRQAATLFPKKGYYELLFVVHTRLAQNNDALDVLRVAKQQGFLLEPDELRNSAIIGKLIEKLIRPVAAQGTVGPG